MLQRVLRFARAAILLGGSAAATLSASGQYTLKEILARENVTRLDRPLTVPLNVRRVDSVATQGGFAGALDDRWHSSEAFRSAYRDEFREGLIAYLQTRGFSVGDLPDAIEVKVTLDEFNGRKRVHDDGGDLRGSLTLLRSGSTIATVPLFESLSYRNANDERRSFARQYKLKEVLFDTVIFYRLSVSLYSAIAEAVVDRMPRQ
jgi:hypothetical protein